ncbi:GntR family transcriptional regulator [Szabonella alba]|uniref:GntR family transcriptional regulator n=1 Tax=Szabonella alba TaxID=2804194 RepID=A0A8K0VC63_9RHOB|nr:GntR family transcriptional regulator [Szabonella alba]MBL4916572.1 GntR family transcriptional regulator [Szabonella alba]
MNDSVIAPGSTFTIRKETLHDQVADRIRDLIIEGHLEPGTRIDEARLVEQLGVSRTPFREALRTLAAEGLVVIRPSRGAHVRKLSREDIFSMLELLARLESFAAELVCKRATDADLAGLSDLHDRMMGFYAIRDRMPYYKLNQEFHTQLTALTGNSALIETQGNLQARLKRIRFMGNRNPDLWAASVGEHEEMMAALMQRDGNALGAVMERHLLNAWDRVADTF